MCLLSWGSNFPSFMGVIESLSTRYTMFFRDGTPCRATCSIKMKQANKLEKEKGSAQTYTKPAPGQTTPGTTAQQGDERRADKFGDDHRKVLDQNGSDDGTLKAGQPVQSDPASQLE
jgi:hypothetical protein